MSACVFWGWRKSVIKNRRTAEHYRWGRECETWRLLDQPDLAVIEELIPAGEGEVKHFHRRARQLFIVLKGQMQIDFDDQRFTLVTGDAIEVAPQQAHRVRNASAEPLTLLVISAPSTHGDREESEPLQAQLKG
jgi:mannose-6-phosphate isomerase-like protein (cupin superfamily)